MPSKSLDQLEGVVWGEPSFDSHVVTTCHRLRTKPIDEFGVEDLRIMTFADLCSNGSENDNGSASTAAPTACKSERACGSLSASGCSRSSNSGMRRNRSCLTTSKRGREWANEAAR